MPENQTKPLSVTLFGVFMYLAVAASLATLVYQYAQYFTSEYFSIMAALFTLFTPLMLATGKLVLVFMAAQRRMNWARIILVVLFATGLLSLLNISRLAFYANPLLLFIALLPTLLEVVALCFAFSKSSNVWFKTADSPVGISLASGQENRLWSKVIPRINILAMVVSLLLVFGLDLSILISEPDLAPFWVVMLAVLIIFGVFFICENYSYKKRFSTSQSKLDTWFVVLVVLRNIVFILNFIPFIQILGGAALVFGGVPYLIVYGVLQHNRSKAAPALSVQAEQPAA